MRRLVATAWVGVNAVVASASFGVGFAPRTRLKRVAAPRFGRADEVYGSARKAPLGTLLRPARDRMRGSRRMLRLTRFLTCRVTARVLLVGALSVIGIVTAA